MFCLLLCRMQRADPQHATEQGLSPRGSTSPIYCLFLLLFCPSNRACVGIASVRKGPVIERECKVSTSSLLSGNKGRARGHQREGRGEGTGRETSDCFGSLWSPCGEKKAGISRSRSLSGLTLSASQYSPRRDPPYCSQQRRTPLLLQRQSNWMASIFSFRPPLGSQ